jgi:hypothetical protein
LGRGQRQLPSRPGIHQTPGGQVRQPAPDPPAGARILAQPEIYFSVVQRKALTPNDFVDLAEVTQRLLGFQRRYQQTAAPFDWRYTRTDLDRLLRRLDDKGQQQFTKAA